MTTTTEQDLVSDAIAHAIWEAECDQDFLAQVCTAYIASLNEEEIRDYLGTDNG
jgi:hypothetical protein